MRRLTPIEWATGFALVGSLVCVAVPAFMRELHASRFVEPASGLPRLGAAVIERASRIGAFDESAPLTPAVVPRGKAEVDGADVWSHPTWVDLGFRATPPGAPHAFSFALDASGAFFVAHAHGDLDGDGVRSTFEIRGSFARDRGPTIEPGMYVEAEVE